VGTRSCPPTGQLEMLLGPPPPGGRVRFPFPLFPSMAKQAMASAAGLFGHAKVLETVTIVADKLVKEIITQGTGSAKPAAGSNVKAHYVGKLLSGADFDSSRKRGRPFTFDIGQGSVIRGWDCGIATMSKGEKSVFTIAPDYAYGAAGAGGVIPPNASSLPPPLFLSLPKRVTHPLCPLKTRIA
jgi:FK506-binding protein 1